MRAYRLIVIFLLFVNFGLLFALYRAYYAILNLTYQNALILKTSMRHYDIFCSIFDIYGPISNFSGMWHSVAFLKAYRFLPTELWYVEALNSAKLGSAANLVSSGGGFSVLDWFKRVSSLKDGSYELAFQFRPIRWVYDYIGEAVFDFFGFNLSPGVFLAISLSVVFFPLILYTFFLDRGDDLLVLQSKRLYQLENFVATKLNDGKPIDFTQNWSPISTVRSDSPERSFDPYLAYWIKLSQKLEQEERDALARSKRKSEADQTN